MTEQDRDIEELERLFGPAVADYRALKHAGELPQAQPARRRPVVLKIVAVAASVALAVGLLASLYPAAQAPIGSGGSPQISSSLPSLPASRPLSISTPRAPTDLARMSVRTSVPSRPRG